MMKKKLLTVLICSLALSFCISGSVLGAEDPPQGEGYHDGETEEGDKDSTDSPNPAPEDELKKIRKMTRKIQIQITKRIPETTRESRNPIKSQIRSLNRNSPNQIQHQRGFRRIHKHKNDHRYFCNEINPASRKYHQLFLFRWP